jgi:hypothetical protein
MSRAATGWVSGASGATLDNMPATAETASKPPPATVVEAIRRHHEDEHGLTFDLDRDVYFPGNTPDGTTYDISLDPARGDKFFCAICGPGTSFLVGELPYGTAKRNAFLQQTSPHLQGLLAGARIEDHDALTEAFDRQELGRLRPSDPSARPTVRRRGKTAAVRHSPGYQRRLDGFRPYFLDAYAETGSIERAIAKLVALHDSDLSAYTEVLGTSRPLNEETFRQYVYGSTNKDEREQAKDRWHVEQEKRRAERRTIK